MNFVDSLKSALTNANVKYQIKSEYDGTGNLWLEIHKDDLEKASEVIRNVELTHVNTMSFSFSIPLRTEAVMPKNNVK